MGAEEIRLVEDCASLLDEPGGAAWLAEFLLRIRNKAGKLQPLHANRAQQLFEERRGPENIVLKARQMGLSTWIAGRFLLRTILVPGTTTLMVAHTRESAESLFMTVARMWENLPTWLGETTGPRGRANIGQMTFPRIDSQFRVASASEPNAGRGLTVHNLHCSEVARWTGDAAETLAGLRAALAPGGELVLESTPNGAYGCFHAEWQAAQASGMVQHFFPWWFEPSYVSAAATDWSSDEQRLVTREGLSPEQIGFRRTLTRRFGAMRAQEFAEDAVSCFRSSGSCFFDLPALEARLSDLTPAWEYRRNSGLQVWLPPVSGRRYLVAADPAGGGSEGDFAAVQVIDRATGVQCAELQARLPPRDLARAAAELAREYNGALLVVERNNHGAAVLAYLEKELAGSAAPVTLYEGADRMPGWLTDSASRPRMLGRLAVLLASQPELMASGRLLAECRSFVTDEHGRAGAATGMHDDLVMSMAIAQAVRLEVVNWR
ncbi:MAG: hypothetical protein ACRYF4_10685 [Janthinobacterium lividum]